MHMDKQVFAFFELSELSVTLSWLSFPFTLYFLGASSHQDKGLIHLYLFSSTSSVLHD